MKIPQFRIEMHLQLVQFPISQFVDIPVSRLKAPQEEFVIIQLFWSMMIYAHPMPSPCPVSLPKKSKVSKAESQRTDGDQKTYTFL